MVRVAIEGCCHGALNEIYRAIPKNAELLLICGDFQAFRNKADLQSFSAPEKYRHMMDFHEYYSGKRKAPVLTVFIGGNHEASSYLRELQFGGWVAPSIYYLGEYGTIWYKGLRISGTSGIFNYASFINKDSYKLPYDRSAIRSVYHVKPKNFVKQLLTGHCDIVLSHDWPQWVWESGNAQALVKKKKHFQQDMKSGRLGSPLAMEVLKHLRPRHWFSSHLHIKFTAEYKHRKRKLSSSGSISDSQPTSPKETIDALNQNDQQYQKTQKIQDDQEIMLDMDSNEILVDVDAAKNPGEIGLDMDAANDSGEIALDMDASKNDSVVISSDTDDNAANKEADASKPLIQALEKILTRGQSQKFTKFLALDKCLPKRKFLEVLDIKADSPSLGEDLFYDPKAIAIHRVVENVTKTPQWMDLNAKKMLRVSDLEPLLNELDEKVQLELRRVSGDLRIPHNFKSIAPNSTQPVPKVQYWENNQTTEFCQKFAIGVPSME